MRSLPSPPTSAAFQSVKTGDSTTFIWPHDTSTYSTPLTAQSFVVRLPIGVELPKASGAPRILKARRREGVIFGHSPSSSVSSLDSSSSFGSVIKAEFWMPPQPAVSVPVAPLVADETKTLMPPTPTTPKTKTKSKPANIMIPRNSPDATPTLIVSPVSPSNPAPASVSFPTMTPEAVLCTSPPQTPLSPFLPLSPLSPNRRVQTPNARIRKMAKLTRTLGENVPIELVFPGAASTSAAAAAPSLIRSASPAPALAPKPAKRAKLLFSDSVQRVLPSGPRTRTPTPCPTSQEWPLTPTPDCTINAAAHTRTAVGLHYALGLDSLPTRSATPAPAPVPAHAAPVNPASPAPFSNVFNVDDVSWERARQVAMAPRAKASQQPKRVLGGVRKAPAPVLVEANGRGAWRKKENTWSGEWNVEDMEELQVRLRRLRRL
ncbi:hypothetical protein DFH08DRAFT_965460 [Mycena albidolilacea]|uniref:Uncharacterized protein n=1 Tax=Mycena albidolilacea TaxID=1033008 RepID=A0AAD6ZR08_9AGAR|nr:hypothetical protein DFH08DRAFT_965460 [Mycena albidolilacea]